MNHSFGLNPPPSPPPVRGLVYAVYGLGPKLSNEGDYFKNILRSVCVCGGEGGNSGVLFAIV